MRTKNGRCVGIAQFAAFTIGLLSVLSCSDAGKVKGSVITIEPSEEIELFTLTKDVDIIPLQENISVLGNIMSSKTYKGFHLLFDDGRHTLYVYDNHGKQIQVLNKLGRVDNEYMDIGTYSYCPESRQILIFERATKSIKKYDINDGAFCGSVKMDHYLNAMESINEFLVAGVREAGRDKGAAIELIDTRDGSIKQQIDIRADQAELMMDICFSPASIGNMKYIAVPGHPNKIYSISEDGITLSEEFLYSPDALGERYWTGEYDDTKEGILMEALEDGGILPLSPVMYTANGNKSSFWFVTSEER